MIFRLRAGIALMAGLVLIGACGEEIPEPQAARNEAPDRPACELIREADLQQIFVNPLAPDTDDGSLRHCTWVDAASGEPFVYYELHPYMENLQADVASLEQESDELNQRYIQGIGDAAVWTDIGLFVNRNGRTLQVRPLQDDRNKAPYQELARLLLTRLES